MKIHDLVCLGWWRDQSSGYCIHELCGISIHRTCPGWRFPQNSSTASGKESWSTGRPWSFLHLPTSCAPLAGHPLSAWAPAKPEASVWSMQCVSLFVRPFHFLHETTGPISLLTWLQILAATSNSVSRRRENERSASQFTIIHIHTMSTVHIYCTHTLTRCFILTHLVLVQIVSQFSSASDDLKKTVSLSLVHLNLIGQIKCT